MCGLLHRGHSILVLVSSPWQTFGLPLCVASVALALLLYHPLLVAPYAFLPPISLHLAERLRHLGHPALPGLSEVLRVALLAQLLAIYLCRLAPLARPRLPPLPAPLPL